MMRACFFRQFCTIVAYTRIKICGITRPEDARVAVDSGADAIGLVFYDKSPRCLDAERAARIAAVVPPFVTVVALFVDELAANIARILDHVPVDLIQFHGDEDAAFCQQFGRPWIKAVRVKSGMDLRHSCLAYRGARGILLDNWEAGIPGGTGRSFDWSLAESALPLPVVLAGGLNEGNVAAAMARVGPAAVDVSGGVERSPGVKDAGKLRRFVAAVRAAQ
jgi:phosphoribosylanthranilate isomerase